MEDPNNYTCGAKRFEFEPPTFCCDNGKIELAPTKIPDDLQELFLGRSEESSDQYSAVQFYFFIHLLYCGFRQRVGL